MSGLLHSAAASRPHPRSGAASPTHTWVDGCLWGSSWRLSCLGSHARPHRGSFLGLTGLKSELGASAGPSRLCAQVAPKPWLPVCGCGAFSSLRSGGFRPRLQGGSWPGLSSGSAPGTGGAPARALTPRGGSSRQSGWAGGSAVSHGQLLGAAWWKGPRRDSSTRAAAALTADPGEARGPGVCWSAGPAYHTCQQRGGQSGLPSRGGWRAGLRGRAGPPPALHTSGHPCPRRSLVPAAGRS